MDTHISYPQSLLEHMPHDADEFSKSFRAFLTTYFFPKIHFQKNTVPHHSNVKDSVSFT